MARAGVEHDGEVRLHDGAELVHVAGVADAGLHDPEALVALRCQHGHGHAYLVVVVHLGLGGFAGEREHAGEHLLDRGLAGRAGEAHDLARKGPAPGMGHLAQRLDAVLDQEHGDAGALFGKDRQGTLGQHGAGASVGRAFRKVVAVDPFAGDADEEAAGNGGPAVGSDGGDGDVAEALCQGGVRGPGRAVQTQAHWFTFM